MRKFLVCEPGRDANPVTSLETGTDQLFHSERHCPGASEFFAVRAKPLAYEISRGSRKQFRLGAVHGCVSNLGKTLPYAAFFR